MQNDFSSAMLIIGFIVSIVTFVFNLLGLPFRISEWRKLLREKLSKYNHKEKVIIATGLPSIFLAGALILLAFLQFVNSIPTLSSIQTLPANSIPRGFIDLMWFGVGSGIICSLVGFFLFKINWKELRIVFSPKSFG